MKRTRTLLFISLFLAMPFFCFIPITTVHGQDDDATFIIGTLDNYVNFDPIIGEGGISSQLRRWSYECLL